MSSERRTGDRAATATATISIRQPAPVVLKDGTSLQAVSVIYAETEVRLRFADGHKEVYPVSEVDLEASKGLARFQPNQPRRSSSGDLRSFAKKTSLKLPAENAQANSANAKAGGGTLSIGSTSYENDGDSAKGDGAGQGDLPPELRADIQALANGWGGFDRALAEVERICTGYIQGKASCGGSSVVSKRNTAYCKDAIDRARPHLPGLESTHTRLWNSARHAGVSPGDVRAALRERGLLDFRNQIDRADSTLDAWHGNLVD